MSDGPRRGVTRGYVGGLIAAAAIVAVALTVACWGIIALLSGRDPVTSAVSAALAPSLLVAAIAMLCVALWRQALALLRGRRSVSAGVPVSLAGGAYLVWCLGGGLGGLSIDETWLSPFAAVLAPIWASSSLLFWSVLARRVYTDRPAPRWPWEREDDGE